MKMNNKGFTLAEVLISLILVEVFFVFGLYYFVGAYKLSYQYADVVYNVDTAVNILEKQKRNIMARRPDGTLYAPNLRAAYSTNPGSPDLGNTAFVSPRPSYIEGWRDTATMTGAVNASDPNYIRKKPALLEVNYVAVFPVIKAPRRWSSSFAARVARAMNLPPVSGRPKYVIALRTHYASGMFENI